MLLWFFCLQNYHEDMKICSTCKTALDKNKIPTMSTFNGFKYPPMPTDPHLPPLDQVSERLISPRLPFMQIRRLRHVHGQFGIYGQVINIPVEVNTMVNILPRNIHEEHNVFVHIKRQITHKSDFLNGYVNHLTLRRWLEFLIPTPLYKHYGITVDESFFNNTTNNLQLNLDEISEEILIEESLTAQQHTLLWNPDQYLAIAPGQHKIPKSLLFDEHAEELSFPAIYLGQFREFKENVSVTPFMMASSELRRTDRRAVTPHHLLYMAIKIIRIRVRDSLSIAFKHVGTDTKITKQQIESESYIHNCIETNLAFLRSIPNSTWYWMQRKRDLFAMIRQLGKPPIFLTMSANEIGWPDLLKLLFKLKNGGLEISDEQLKDLSFIDKSTLINEDSVTCAIYFNKIVNAIILILQSKRFSPFGKFRIKHYFKRIEFQHRGSPHAHILLWLENDPGDVLGEGYNNAIELINSLISVSANEASGYIKLKTHKHTFTCYKKIVDNKKQKCRFEAPFMPSRSTVILTPMQSSEEGFFF